MKFVSLGDVVVLDVVVHQVLEVRRLARALCGLDERALPGSRVFLFAVGIDLESLFSQVVNVDIHLVL